MNEHAIINEPNYSVLNIPYVFKQVIFKYPPKYFYACKIPT